MSKFLSAVIWAVKNWYTIYEKTLRVIGDLKVFKTPFFIQYCPEEYDYKVRGESILELRKVIKPGDIVLRSYDHYLDSFLIPGKYSHSGVYIGDDTIVHAVAEGVKKINIIDFCQADAVLVLRPKIGQEDAIERVIAAIGKAYDFKFKTDDDTEFYCHELSAMAYKDKFEIKSVTPSFLGKELKFLRPKYLAESFIDNENFTKVCEIDPV